MVTTSTSPLEQLEHPARAITPGISPKTMGAPTFRISTSWIGPRPALIKNFSEAIFSPEATRMTSISGILLPQASIQVPQPTHFPQKLDKRDISPSLAPSKASLRGSMAGQALLHCPQMLHSSIYGAKSSSTSRLSRFESHFGSISRHEVSPGIQSEHVMSAFLIANSSVLESFNCP